MDSFEPSRRYALGASFIDPISGLWFVADSPASNPDGWTSYLDGAERAYRHYGVERVLDRPNLQDGGSVSLFWRAVNIDGEVIAGIRCHGPIDEGSEVFAFAELAGHPRLEELRWVVWARRQLGVVEMKGAWVSVTGSRTEGLSAALARCCVHSLDWFAARYALCTSSTHSLGAWASTGCRAMEGYDPVPYPDDRYATVPMWWDRHRSVGLATGKQARLLTSEAEQLVRSSLTIRAELPLVAP